MKKLITGSRNRPGLDAAKKADRSSNIELLRIAAMALIVSNHLVNHGILKVTSAAPYELWPQGSVLNRMVCAAFSTGGRIGVAVFFMITGYFLAGRERFSWNPLIRLLIRVHFFAALDFVIFLLFRALIGYGKSFSISEMALKSFVIPITLWWFALAYAVLILLAPFINRGIRWLGRIFRGAAYPLLILVFWYLYAVGMTWSVYIIIRAVFFYLIGAMIGTMRRTDIRATGREERRTSSREESRTEYRTIEKSPSPHRGRSEYSRTAIVIWAAVCVLAWICCGILTYADAELYANNGNHIYQAVYWGWTAQEVLNIFLIPLVAAALLLTFEKIEMKSRLINRIAGATFGMYLLHEYKYSRVLLWNIFLKVDTVQFMSPFFPLLMIADVVLIMGAGFAAEELRLKLAGIIRRLIESDGGRGRG